MYKYEDAIGLLIDKFPELKSIYEDNIDDYEDLPYVFFESVFEKFILNKINLKDTKEIHRIFSIIEDFLERGDEKIKNLVEVAIIESLFFENDYENFIKVISPSCGRLTLKSFNECIK